MKWKFGLKSIYNTIKKSVPKVGGLNEQTREGIHKSYIPDFLYKPPFGYPRYVDLTTIRRLAASPYVDMCITTIIDEMMAIPWDIVYEDEESEVPNNVQTQIDQVKNFLYNPNTNKENFEHIMKKVIRDILEVDSGIIEKSFNMAEQMVEITARDGSTFTRNPDLHGMLTNRADFLIGDYIVYNDELKKQGIENPNIEPNWITAEDAREKAAYFQYGWITGARPIPFGKREIVWFERNPRTDSLYGRSPVEVLADTIQMLIYSVDHNLEYYNDNSIPKGIIGLEGADKDEIKAFQDQWKEQMRTQDEVGNWRKKFHHVPVVGQVPEFKRVQFSNAELELIEQQRWFGKMVWACYDDETEILTENGWKLFKDLENDKVARVNPKDLEIDFIKPIDKQEYDFDGEMIKYNTKSCDLKVTPEHKMLQCNDNGFFNGKENWTGKEAKDFNRGIIPQAGNFKGEEIEELNFKSKCKQISKDFDTQEFKITGDNFVKFMGFWLSDGWVESSNNRVCLCASDVYPENKEFIKNLLKDMNVDYSVRISEPNAIIQGKKVNVYGNMNCYRFSNKAFADYLMQFGHAKEKYVPKIIKNSTKEQRKLFLDAFRLGDGSEKSHGKNNRYGSMSKQLADDVQEILITSGISATVFKNKNNCWEITERKNKTNKIKNKYYSSITNKAVTKKKYKGKVYDVTIPEYHYLVVRRNGRVSISGNCFGITPSELGYTEDSNKASEIVQSRVFRRKAINPLVRLLEYKLNSEIISEFDFEKVKFKFLTSDTEEETKKFELYKLQTESGIRTINEIRRMEGLEEVEWGNDAPKDWKQPDSSFSFNPMFSDQNQQMQNEQENMKPKNDEKEEKSIETKPGMGRSEKWWEIYHKLKKEGHSDESAAKIASSQDKKALTGDENNPLVLREGETIDDSKLEQGIIYLIDQYRDKINKLVEQESGEGKLNEIKDLGDLAKKLKSILTFEGLRKVSDTVIKKEFMKGWDNQEKQLNMNFVPSKEAIEFLQNYTFDNIKEMGNEMSNDLRQELQRGIMNGEGIDKIKKRVQNVMKTSKNRAEKIARTETNRAENTGTHQVMKNVADDYNKKWLAAMDDRTSDLCKRLHEKTIGINEHFKDNVSGEEFMTPPAHVNCFDKNTEVYTNEGWKYFKDLNGKEKIWSLNPENLNPEWVNYKNFIKMKSDKIVEYKSNQFDTAVTPNHNQFIKFRKKQKGRNDAGEWKLIQEKKLPNHDFNFYKGIKWDKKSPEKIKINNKEFDYKAFARFMGWFLSEGNYTKGKNYIKISQEKEEFMSKLIGDMINVSEKVEKWTGGVYVFDKDLIEYVKQFGKSYEKYIPKEIKQADSGVIKEFLDAFCMGDGSIRKGKHWKGHQFNDSRAFFTSSKKMAGELGELIMKIGKSVSYKLDNIKGKEVQFKNGKYTINYDIWRIYELNGLEASRDRMAKEIKDYNDYVYDVELDKNNILLTRREGKIVWSGNCRSTLVYLPK